MPEGTGLSFAEYFRQWIKASIAPAWDLFGGLGVLLGLGLWAWNRYWPLTFKGAMAAIGFTPEAAMSDLVWQIPLGAGLLAFAYRFIRAPYEIHQAAQDSHRTAVAALRQEVDQLRASGGFNIEVRHGGYYLTQPEPGDEEVVMPGTWFVCYDIVITNRTEKQLPLEIWVQIGMNPEATWRYGEVAVSAYPAWALPNVGLEGVKPFERVLNLPGLSSVTGFCVCQLTDGAVVKMAGLATLKELAEQRPFWLEIKNNLTGQSHHHGLNHHAHLVDLQHRSRATEGGFRAISSIGSLP